MKRHLLSKTIATGTLLLLSAGPAFAATTSVDTTCAVNAVGTRDDAIMMSFQNFSSAMLSAYNARRDALKIAWANTDAPSRKVAVKNAWTNFKNATKSARTNWKNGKEAAWSNFKLAIKTCKVKDLSSETSNKGADQ